MDMEQFGVRAAGAARMFWKKHGAAILTTAGIAGFGATTVLVGRAVLKSEKKIDNFKFKHKEILHKDVDALYTQQDKAKEMGDLWLRDGKLILQDFAPAIAVGTMSVVCVIASHNIMRNQKAALAAAYTALDASYRAYRMRVQEKIGIAEELELYKGVKTRERQQGGDPELPCEIDYTDRHPSPYSRYFDETNPNWSRTPDYNRFFLSTAQKYFNDRLMFQGYVFLNEVYEHIGIPRSQAGQIVGWKTKEHGGKDGFIDFGLYDISDEMSRAFVNGTEVSILLDFNVDGPITID